MAHHAPFLLARYHRFTHLVVISKDTNVAKSVARLEDILLKMGCTNVLSIRLPVGSLKITSKPIINRKCTKPKFSCFLFTML